jgi:hypothetical protein
MKPVQNTIHGKKVKLMEIEAHFSVDGGRYAITQHLFDPPVYTRMGDTITITWNIKVEE